MMRREIAVLMYFCTLTVVAYFAKSKAEGIS